MKKYLVLVLAVLMVAALTTGALAGPAGKSNVGHLYLFEKDADWVIVDGGAWGKMKYNLSGEDFEFVFNGHGLDPESNYCLIYYPDPWPGNGLICLAEGTPNRGGNLHLRASSDTGDLPAEWDQNHPSNQPDGTTIYGAKIWLVLSSDVSHTDQKMIGWHLGEYLFEGEGIFFKNTDD